MAKKVAPKKFKLYHARYDSMRGGAPYMHVLEAYQEEGVLSFTIGEYSYQERPAGYYDTPEEALQAYVLQYSKIYREQILKLRTEIEEVERRANELLAVSVESCKENR